MGYSVSDLIVFQILRDKTALEGTSYFELHPGEPPEPFACWLEGSVFIRDAGFDFFVKCFEEANSQFDYFAFEAFDAIALGRLGQALARFEGALAPGCSRESVFSRYASLFDCSIWDAVDTESLRVAIASAGGELRSFIEQARDEAKRLWVMGM